MRCVLGDLVKGEREKNERSVMSRKILRKGGLGGTEGGSGEDKANYVLQDLVKEERESMLSEEARMIEEGWKERKRQ